MRTFGSAIKEGPNGNPVATAARQHQYDFEVEIAAGLLGGITFFEKQKNGMQEKKEFTRNRPTEEGNSNDPNLRDEDARQGGNTMSTSPTDSAKENLTRTTSDNFREDGEGDEKADKRFDE